MDYRSEIVELLKIVTNERLIRIIYGMLEAAAKKEEGR